MVHFSIGNLISQKKCIDKDKGTMYMATLAILMRIDR